MVSKSRLHLNTSEPRRGLHYERCGCELRHSKRILEQTIKSQSWTCVCVHPVTLYPGGSPGSHKAADSMRTSRSWMKVMWSPTFSSPAWSTASDGTSALMSKPRTFPKQRRNCITIRQSAKHPPGKTRPGIRDSAGRGWKREREVQIKLSSDMLG